MQRDCVDYTGGWRKTNMNIEHTENNSDLVMDSLVRLDSWIDRNGWTGYDPYDIKGTKLFLSMGNVRYFWSVANIIADRFPGASIKVFRVNIAWIGLRKARVENILKYVIGYYMVKQVAGSTVTLFL